MRGSKTKVAHKWAWWLHHRCCLGEPQRFRARDRNKSGPQVGLVAKGPLPFGGFPTLQCGGQKQKRPTSGLGPCHLGGPQHSRAGNKNRNGPHWAWWLHHCCRLGVPNASKRETKTNVRYKWACWVHHCCRLGVPNASKRGIKSEVAHKWAWWLHHLCHVGGPQCFRAGYENKSGPQVGLVATSPLPTGGPQCFGANGHVGSPQCSRASGPCGYIILAT